LGGGQLPACGSLSLSIDHALEGLVTLHLIKARRGVCLYDHIDFLKLFGKIHQKDGSIVLDNLHLQHLMDYDRINKSGYLQTLRVYLANNCNITQTAKQLFLHRHTLINRLEKIEEISGLYLDDYYSRLYISIAMFLHDYFIY
jgi:sugar diacid utilization regulator